MPNPVAPPPSREGAAPGNLDELVRRAMAGNVDVRALKAALGGQGSATPTTPAARPATTSPPPPAAPPAAVAPPSPPVAPPASATPPTAVAPPAPELEELRVLLGQASARLRAGDSVEASKLLARLAARADDAARRLGAGRKMSLSVKPAREAPVDPPELPAEALAEVEAVPADSAPPPRPRLGPSRHPHALVMAEPPAGTETAALAAALGVDLATARAAALAGGTRLVMRSPDGAGLRERAHRLQLLGVAACVVDREELLAQPAARAVTGVDSLDVLRVVDAALWALPPDPTALPRGEPLVLGSPRLLVVGEVEERRLRPEPQESRWQRAHYAAPRGAGGETRRLVLDLHAGGEVLRLAEGACDLSALDLGAGRVALRALPERLADRWPELVVEPRRVCPAAPVPGDERREDGWGTWEEHSRACAALRAATLSR